jgi:TetR/AcrR family transcriptional regulator, mexCD-oprJ operon repressor
MAMPEASRHAVPRQALQERVATAILEAAASVLLTRGEQASMNDVAVAAGVARATVYRYFPNRQTLLDELGARAISSAGERLAAARIDEIPVADGIARAVRALVDVGEPFVVLARERLQPDAEQFEHHVGGPLRALVERGQAEGELRADVPSAWLTDALMGVVVGILSSTLQRGREDTVAAITGVYIDGARRPGAAAAA